MGEKWLSWRDYCVLITLIYLCSVTAIEDACQDGNKGESVLDKMLKNYVDSVLNVDEYQILPGIGIEKALNATEPATSDITNLRRLACEAEGRGMDSIQHYVHWKLKEYSRTHVLAVRIPETARLFFPDAGKSSFLTGFGMGFLAFALKKLLLPVFIGAQLVKSVVIAMFLPSILANLGKVLGKGLSTFSGMSGASAGLNNNNNQVEDFEFKDTNPYENDGSIQEYNVEGEGLSINGVSSTVAPLDDVNRLTVAGNQRISYVSPYANHLDNYYMRKPNKKTDYKVFHKIPSSSLLLTTYDPFYSPLLSRLDAVFQQLGLGNDKSPETEKCRERLVCLMYANPAKFAPYSNLVSAQLSRELNELRKPASDNPEILRFFRYMKAAKDGQDGEECLAHGGCPSLTVNQPSPAILTTYNDINKLVQARKFT